MDDAGVTADDIDWIVPHQANIRIIQGTAKKMGVPMDKCRCDSSGPRQHIGGVDPAGLVGGAPARPDQGRDDLIVTEAIGGGLAWGAVVVRW